MSKGLEVLKTIRHIHDTKCEKDESINKCFDIIEKELKASEILKPRIKLSHKTIKYAVFSDYNRITQVEEEREVVFISASGFVFKNSKEHKLLKEWLENERN